MKINYFRLWLLYKSDLRIYAAATINKMPEFNYFKLGKARNLHHW